MLHIKENIELRPYNTFGVSARAMFFFELEKDEDIAELVQSGRLQKHPYLVLGEGSNVLFTGDYPGLVIRVCTKGIKIIKEDPFHIWLEVKAGENWDAFVAWCVDRGYGGPENLSLIPGTVGASPIQNIGAYGTEISHMVEKVHTINLSTGEYREIANSECKFSYRNSIFKAELKGQVLITSVMFRLMKKDHILTRHYGAVEERLKEYDEVNIKNLRKVVCSIREEKLPDPAKIGNAGSFFKNPVVSQFQFLDLKKKYTEIPFYPADEENIKIPAAWLIDQAGCKGIRRGQTGTHPGQPLVIINHGGASGKEILELAKEIKEVVFKDFGIRLEPEVNIIN